jgi:hypothetical protein
VILHNLCLNGYYYILYVNSNMIVWKSFWICCWTSRSIFKFGPTRRRPK